MATLSDLLRRAFDSTLLRLRDAREYLTVRTKTWPRLCRIISSE